ncbi:MAG: alkaline phosphatase, partial [Burkholderiales bacterium]|nr:alkaline phosphatase [Burkholderiales bacterium]
MSETYRQFVRAFAVLLIAAAAAGCATQQMAQTPRNVIIMYADGAAATQFEFGRYSSEVLRKQSYAVTDTVLKQGTIGLLTTFPYEAFATDSAATASAMSTGVKTTIGAIGVGPDGKPVRTAAEAAKAGGKRIGLITTSEIWDASPAAFSVHARNRSAGASIVDQYLALEPYVILGGGADFFLPKPGGKRDDGKDVIAGFRAKGYTVARNTAELRAASSGRLLGLFSDEALDHTIDRAGSEEPTLAEMTEVALRVISANSPQGFFLFVENESTDTLGHRNDAAGLMREMWTFDDAVKVALEFQRRSPDTLVIVTGDHETGALSATYALKDLSTTSSKNRFYASKAQLEMLMQIKISLDKAAEQLGKKPDAAALDKLVAENFPGFKLDADLRDAILKQQLLERNFSYPTQNTLGRMVSRQTGIYWGTSGHSTEPVVVGAIGPGAERFKGYMDNTDFGKILQQILERQ